jgi:hypothetical protein
MATIALGACADNNVRTRSSRVEANVPGCLVDLFSGEADSCNMPAKVVRATNLGAPVEFAVCNNSSEPFYYLTEGRYGKNTIQLCRINLYRDGTLVPHIESIENAGVVPSLIRVLNPGETIRYSISLLTTYGIDQKRGAIPPGDYELRAEYSVKEADVMHEVGCTPIELDQRIMWIKVVDD